MAIMKGIFVADSVWKDWETTKTKLVQKYDSLRFGLSFSDHHLWWSPFVLFGRKSLAESVWFLAKFLFRRGIKIVRNLYDSLTRE